MSISCSTYVIEPTVVGLGILLHLLEGAEFLNLPRLLIREVRQITEVVNLMDSCKESSVTFVLQLHYFVHSYPTKNSKYIFGLGVPGKRGVASYWC